jgi:hypothetical protein
MVEKSHHSNIQILHIAREVKVTGCIDVRVSINTVNNGIPPEKKAHIRNGINSRYRYRYKIYITK